MADRNPNNDAPDGWEHYRELLRGLPDRQPPAGHGARLERRLAEAVDPSSANKRPWSDGYLKHYLLSALALASAVVITFIGLNRGTDSPQDVPIVRPAAQIEAEEAPVARPPARRSKPRLPEPTVTGPLDIYVDSTPPQLPDGGRAYPVPYKSADPVVTGVSRRPPNDRRPGDMAEPMR